MSIVTKILRALRAPSKETQRPLWVLHIVMISVILGFKLVWIIWDPDNSTASWAFTWVWIGVLVIGVSVEVVLRLHARKQRSSVLPGSA